MASAGGRLQAYEKTSVEAVERSYPSVVRFAGHVQLKGVRPRTVEAYGMMVRLLTRWAERDPAELEEERVRKFFLHLIRDRQYAPHSIREARAALTAFYMEMLERTDWAVFASVKTKDPVKLPVVLSRDEVRKILRHVRELRFAVPLLLIYVCGLRLPECQR